MPPDAVIIVSDAHLGQAPPESETAFRGFLATVPDVANHLIINGDLFDFWFEYRRVIPKEAFPTLSALHQARSRGVKLTVIGGNHDRWGGDFWVREMQAEFQRESLETSLLGRRALIAHGDGLSESRPASRVMHSITKH